MTLTPWLQDANSETSPILSDVYNRLCKSINKDLKLDHRQ